MIRTIRKYFFCRSGATTTEFAVAFPFLMWILFMFVEIGVFSIRTSLLKRGLSMATRDVRTGDPAIMSIDAFRSRVCDYTYALSDCNTSLNIEMTPIVDGDFTQFKCINRENEDWTPSTTFDPGAREQIMLVRACLLVKPVFPGAGIGADLSRELNGEYAIVATSAFQNEPKKK